MRLNKPFGAKRKKGFGGQDEGFGDQPRKPSLLLFLVPSILLVIQQMFFMATMEVKGIEETTIMPSVRTEKPPAKKTLVVYAGPNAKSAPKAKLYEANFNFFLEHGVDCNIQDTVLVVGYDYYDEYLPRIETMQAECSQKLLLVSRRNKCLDLEVSFMTFHGGIAGINVHSYDYMVYVNCGMTGPPPRNSTSLNNRPWTSKFIDLLDDEVKMSGVSINAGRPHVQSFVYALDNVGIDILYNSNAVYDCLQDQHPTREEFWRIVKLYEDGMSRAILDAGFALRPLIGNYTVSRKAKLDKAELEKKNILRDIWFPRPLRRAFGGRLPTLEEVIFFKTSRFLPPEIKQQIYKNNHTSGAIVNDTK